MSSTSSPVLMFELGRSRWRWLPVGVLLVALASMPWLADLTVVPRVLIWLIGAGVIGVACWRAGIGQPTRYLTGITWQQDQQWRLQFAAGEAVQARLLGRSWVSPWLICLSFRDQFDSGHQVMVWRFEMPTNAWQQWQLRLRLEAGRLPRTAGLPS